MQINGAFQCLIFEIIIQLLFGVRILRQIKGVWVMSRI
jgi:hypothetical protein